MNHENLDEIRALVRAHMTKEGFNLRLSGKVGGKETMWHSIKARPKMTNNKRWKIQIEDSENNRLVTVYDTSEVENKLVEMINLMLQGYNQYGGIANLRYTTLNSN